MPYLVLPLPVGLLLLYLAAPIARTADLRRPGDMLLPLLLTGIGMSALALGLWTSVEGLESAARRPASPLRPLAGTGRAFLRPALSAAALGGAGWLFASSWPPEPWVRFLLFACALPLLLSAYLCFQGAPSAIASWRAVGAMTLTVSTRRAAPGERVSAEVTLHREVTRLDATLNFYDSASQAKDHLAGVWPLDVTLSPGASGTTARVAARIPPDAAPTADGKDDVWRRWELEVWVEHGARRTVESADIEVVRPG